MKQILPWSAWNSERKLDAPLHMRRPRVLRVMSDLFHEKLAHAEIARIFAVMASAPQHTFQILTKRPRRMRQWFAEFLPENVGGWMKGNLRQYVPGTSYLGPWPLPNVWLGVSVEDQKTADERIPLLRQTRAAVRFVSVEPLLEQVDLCLEPGREVSAPDGGRRGIHWVVVGGESGPGARPLDVAWIRSVMRQCREAGVACFVKQLGSWPHRDWSRDEAPLCLKDHGRKLSPFLNLKHPKGGDPSEWPSDLRVREFPS